MSPLMTASATVSDSVGVFGGETRLVLESVGTADAAALRAIRQLVPGAISDAARIVYQAPSELRAGLHADAAAEMQRLLQGLGFCVSVSRADTAFEPGVGEFEIALVVRKMETLPAVITEAAAFLGTDLPTARRLVCRSPAVLVSHVSEATVRAVESRFARLGVDIDISRPHDARYYAVISVDNAAVRRVVIDMIRAIAPEAVIAESDAALVVENLGFAAAEALWERLRRTGARASICNRDLERYDVSLTQAPDTPEVRDLLVTCGVPRRLVDRVLGNLPLVIQQNVSYTELQTLLDRAAALGAVATGVPYAFQRFALVLRSVGDPPAVAKLLASLGDLPESAATEAVARRGVPVGNFTRTTALWLQHVLAGQGCDAGVEIR